MALQSQSTSPLSDFGALLRRRLWHVLLPFAFVTAFGAMFAQLMPRHYMVKTVIKLAENGAPGTGNVIQRDVASAQNDMIAEPLVRKVIESQEWQEYVGLTEREKIDFITHVTSNIKPKVASPSKGVGGSNYITVQYIDADPTRAERFLNALRDTYIQDVVEGVRRNAKETLNTLKDLRKEHEDEWKEAERVKSELAKSKGLSATQPAPGSGQTRNEDPIYVVLNQDRIDHEKAKRDLEAEKARLAITERLLADCDETILESDAVALAATAPGGRAVSATAPEDDVDKQVKDIDVQILEKREKQKDYRPIARAYQVLEEDIGKLESKKKLLKGDSGSGAAGAKAPRYVRNPQIAVYESAISDTKTKIATLEVTVTSLATAIKDLEREQQQRQDVYSQLSWLDLNVQRANATYMQTDQVYTAQVTRVRLLEGKEADPFEVVEVAKASDTPLYPNVPIFILISTFLGLAVGLGTAVAAEFTRNGFKGIPDLTRSLSTPVLGAVNTIHTRAQVRRAMARHAMIAASSLVIVSSILWITWAYQHDPLRRLGPGLTQLIDDVRLAFRP